MLFYWRSQLIDHYNCLVADITKEDPKTALVGAIIKLENGQYDKQLSQALNPEAMRIGTSKMRDVYTTKFETLSSALGKVDAAFAVRKPAVRVGKARGVVALFNDPAFEHYVRVCRSDACKEAVWKAFAKLTPTEADYEARVTESRGFKIGAPFKVRVVIVSECHVCLLDYWCVICFHGSGEGLCPTAHHRIAALGMPWNRTLHGRRYQGCCTDRDRDSRVWEAGVRLHQTAVYADVAAFARGACFRVQQTPCRSLADEECSCYFYETCWIREAAVLHERGWPDSSVPGAGQFCGYLVDFRALW